MQYDPRDNHHCTHWPEAVRKADYAWSEIGGELDRAIVAGCDSVHGLRQDLAVAEDALQEALDDWIDCLCYCADIDETERSLMPGMI